MRLGAPQVKPPRPREREKLWHRVGQVSPGTVVAADHRYVDTRNVRAAFRRVMGRSRAVALTLVLVVIGVAYLAFLGLGYQGVTGIERTVGASQAAEGVRQLDVYVTVLSVDPVNDALHLRLEVTPSRALRGDRPNSVATNLILRLEDGYSVHERSLPANQPIAAATIEANLDGRGVAAYPLERLQAALRISGSTDDAAAAPVPIRLTFWDAVPSWSLRTEGASADQGAVRLLLVLRRGTAITFLAVALLLTMALIAVAAMTIGALIFLRIRKLELTLASVMNGMLFALPAMRLALPGSPPLGVF